MHVNLNDIREIDTKTEKAIKFTQELHKYTCNFLHIVVVHQHNETQHQLSEFVQDSVIVLTFKASKSNGLQFLNGKDNVELHEKIKKIIESYSM